MTAVLIVVDGEVTVRAAHSLSAHPGVSSIALLAPARSSHFPTVEDPDGFDVVVGTDGARRVGIDTGGTVATTEPGLSTPGLSGATVAGLALALAVGVDDLEEVAVALPGQPAGDRRVVFPSPIDGRMAVSDSMDGHTLLVAEGPGPLGAALVSGGARQRVIVDDHAFLSAVALAAAAGVIVEDGMTESAPVWTRAQDYLRVAVEMGLVVGERLAA